MLKYNIFITHSVGFVIKGFIIDDVNNIWLADLYITLLTDL